MILNKDFSETACKEILNTEVMPGYQNREKIRTTCLHKQMRGILKLVTQDVLRKYIFAWHLLVFKQSR